MNYYTKEQLTINSVTVENSNSVRISYSPMLETLYYSPGANIQIEKDLIIITITRCSINEACKVTHKALKDSNGNAIIVKNNGKPIYIFSGDEKLKIFPK